MLKILACGYINREDDYILTEAQVNVLDIATKKTYNVFCTLLNMEQDIYRIKVCDCNSNNVIDEYIMDSSGGIITGDSFSCDEQFGDEILELVIKYLIVEF